MKTEIRKVGNVYSVAIPKELLDRAGLKIGEVDLVARGGAIQVREAGYLPRKGWVEASKAIAKDGGSDESRNS